MLYFVLNLRINYVFLKYILFQNLWIFLEIKSSNEACRGKWSFCNSDVIFVILECFDHSHFKNDNFDIYVHITIF